MIRLAALAGILMVAALLFMRRMAGVTQISYATKMMNDEEEQDGPNRLKQRNVPACVEVFEVNGPFFFGAAGKFKYTLFLVRKKPKVLILRLRSVLSPDATALRALEAVYGRTRREGAVLPGSYVPPVNRTSRPVCISPDPARAE